MLLNRKPIERRRLILLTLLALSMPVASGICAAASNAVAVLEVNDGVLRWTPTDFAGGYELTISGPGDYYLRQSFRSGVVPALALTDPHGIRLPDGSYSWELKQLPRLDPATREALRAARDAGGDVEASLAATLPRAEKQVGYFAVGDGAFVPPIREGGDSHAAPQAGPIVSDVVITNADGVIRNSLCVGLDCPDAPAFGDSTILLMENNTRVKFGDTSVSPFPNNDWEIEANSSVSGGANYLGFNDCGTADNDGGCATDLVFAVESGARASALYVESDGDVGLGTSNPVVDLHVVTGNTPTLRLDQDGSSGFAPQVWDVAGNETNFFVRDVTGGSTLPFRIRPGAPSSSIDIAADGDVGIGTGSPGQKLDVVGDVKAGKTTGGTTSFFIENTGGTNDSSWILRANSSNGAFTFTEAGANTVFRIFKGAASNTLDITSTGVNVVGTLSVGGVAMMVPDYVFDEDYALLPIPDQGRFMSSNRHLPSVPPEQLGEDGRPQIDLVATQMGMLEELEKAHLYIQQLHGQIAELGQARTEVDALRAELAALRAEVAALATARTE